MKRTAVIPVCVLSLLTTCDSVDPSDSFMARYEDIFISCSSLLQVIGMRWCTCACLPACSYVIAGMYKMVSHTLMRMLICWLLHIVAIHPFLWHSRASLCTLFPAQWCYCNNWICNVFKNCTQYLSQLVCCTVPVLGESVDQIQ